MFLDHREFPLQRGPPSVQPRDRLTDTLRYGIIDRNNLPLMHFMRLKSLICLKTHRQKLISYYWSPVYQQANEENQIKCSRSTLYNVGSCSDWPLMKGHLWSRGLSVGGRD